MRNFRRIVLVAAIGTLAGVAAYSAARTQPRDDKLDQGWSPDLKQRWYEASQGSRLLPLSWAKALELAQTNEPFLGDSHMRQLRYLPRTTSSGERLPVGFAVDRTHADKLGWSALTWKTGQKPDDPWLGLNCSACHTAEMTYRGESIRAEGGPALSDFQGLLNSLRESLVATRDDAAKFDRFAVKILGPAPTPEDLNRLRGALTALTARELALGRLNHTDLEYGPGRLDAFGHIYNKVAYSASGNAAPPQAADAPVSYPFLWNVPQHDKVQWNGIADNTPIRGLQTFDAGALGRNAGEVIGVFADVELRPGSLKGYRSSVNVRNLVAMEQQLEKLRPPAWPVATFGWSENHDARVTRGRELFQNSCALCHTPLKRTDLKTPIKAHIQLFKSPDPPGTDIWMACNAFSRVAPSGVLKGTPSRFFKGAPLESEDFLSDLLTVSVAGVLFEQKGEVIKTAAASFFGVNRPPSVAGPVATGKSPRELQADLCMSEASPILGYKARPLTGIWATAPYLHNGSVPTLYDLLLPEAERPKSFRLGTREYDPVKVGYVYTDAPGNAWTFRVADESGRAIPGNSNKGHVYGSALSEADRLALVEYLKTQ